MEEKYLTMKDVAQAMQVNTRTVQRWVSLGRLNPLRMGRTVRFRRSDFLRSLERYEHGDPAPKHDPSMG